MKKIFAFILATIMVLSLVPASAFAAITKVEPCPDPHTLATCPSYTKVETVAPTCANGGQPGYTIYQCNKCDEQFLGDFVDAIEHVWVSTADSTHKDSAANCSKGTPAKKWEKCSVCGEAGENSCDVSGCKDAKCALGYNTYAPEHTLNYKSGYGCEKVYTCSACKKDFYLDAKGNPTQNIAEIGHVWEFTEVTLEPKWENGVAKDGLALYTCKECKDTKEVTILCEHVCILERVSGYKAPTCTATGKYAVYQCPKCLKTEYRTETFDDNGKVTSSTVVELEEGAENVIPMVPHTFKNGGTAVPGKCEITGYCTVCEQTATNAGEHVNVVEVYSKDATCSVIGYKALACNQCHENWIEVIPATGHKTIEVVIEESTCGTKGVAYVLCSNENCELRVSENLHVHTDGKLYAIVTKKALAYDKTKHNIVKTVITEGSCTVNGMYITYCTYGCNEYPYNVVTEKADGHDYYAAVEYRACTYNGVYTYNIDYKCVDCDSTYTASNTVASIPGTFTTEEEAMLYHGLVSKVTTATRGKDGKITYTTTYSEPTAQLLSINKYEPTCTKIGYYTYACTAGCSETFVVVKGLAKHVPTGKLAGYKAATCKEAGNTGYFTCAICGAYYIEVEGEQVVITSKGLTTNKHSDTLKKVDLKNCNGDVVGTYYDCTKCDKFFSDAEASKSISKPTNPQKCVTKTINAGVTTTCEIAGVSKVTYCSICDQLVISTVTDTVDTTLGTDATEKVTDKYNDVLEDSISVYNDEDGVPFITFVNVEEGAEVTYNVCLLTEKIEHEGFISRFDPDDSHTAHNSKCDYTDPLYIHEYCELCGYEYIKEYTGSHKHVNVKGEVLTSDCNSASVKDRNCAICGLPVPVINHTVGDKGCTLEFVTVEATCVAEGYTYEYCTECDYKYVTGKLAKDPDNHIGQYGVEVNYAQNGYKTLPCSACGYKGKAAEMKEKGIELLLSTTINGVEGVKAATLGSTIEVTVSLASLNGVDVWGVDFGLKYNPDVLKFVDFSFNQDSAFASRLATEVYGDFYNRLTGKVETSAAGIISVVAHVDTEDVTIKGSQELVTLTFEVMYEDGQYYDGGFDFAVGNVTDKAWFNSYPVHVIDENDKAVKSMMNGINAVNVPYAPCCDLDASGDITISDIHAIYSLILFGDYDVAADLNADGVLNAEDLRLSYAFLTGANTFTKAFGFPVEEEVVGGGIEGEPRN